MGEQRRFQFSVWNILLMTTVLAAVFGGVAYSVRYHASDVAVLVGTFCILVGVPGAVGALVGGHKGLAVGLMAPWAVVFWLARQAADRRRSMWLAALTVVMLVGIVVMVVVAIVRLLLP